MGGGGAAAVGGAMLPLLFTAARCERTLQTYDTQKEEHSAGAWVSLHARASQQAGAFWVISVGLGIKAIQEPETVPWGTPESHLNTAMLIKKYPWM